MYREKRLKKQTRQITVYWLDGLEQVINSLGAFPYVENENNMHQIICRSSLGGKE